MPLQEGEGRVGVLVVFEHTFYRRSDLQRLKRIADQVADDAASVGRRQFHQHDDVCSLLSEGRMDRMPYALVAVDDALGRSFLEAEVKGAASVAAPFRAPLPATTPIAALKQEAIGLQTLPVGLVQPVWRSDWRREAWVQIGAHSVASFPKTQVLTGVTIGPAIIIDTSASSIWHVD